MPLLGTGSPALSRVEPAPPRLCGSGRGGRKHALAARHLRGDLSFLWQLLGGGGSGVPKSNVHFARSLWMAWRAGWNSGRPEAGGRAGRSCCRGEGGEGQADPEPRLGEETPHGR